MVERVNRAIWAGHEHAVVNRLKYRAYQGEVALELRAAKKILGIPAQVLRTGFHFPARRKI